jgi:hypothetical protein
VALNALDFTFVVRLLLHNALALHHVRGFWSYTLLAECLRWFRRLVVVNRGCLGVRVRRAVHVHIEDALALTFDEARVARLDLLVKLKDVVRR